MGEEGTPATKTLIAVMGCYFLELLKCQTVRYYKLHISYNFHVKISGGSRDNLHFITTSQNVPSYTEWVEDGIGK